MAQSTWAKKVTGFFNSVDKGLQEFRKAGTILKELKEGFQRLNGEDKDHKHE